MRKTKDDDEILRGYEWRFGNEKIAQSKIHLNLITSMKPFHRRSLVGYMNSIEDSYFV